MNFAKSKLTGNGSVDVDKQNQALNLCVCAWSKNMLIHVFLCRQSPAFCAQIIDGSRSELKWEVNPGNERLQSSRPVWVLCGSI